MNPCLIQQSNIKCDEYKQKDNKKTCEIFNDFIVFSPHIPKFSKQKTQVPNHKLKTILIIQHINAEVFQILCYIFLILVSLIIKKIQEFHYVFFP